MNNTTFVVLTAMGAYCTFTAIVFGMVRKSLFSSFLFIGLFLAACQSQNPPRVSKPPNHMTAPVMLITNIVKPSTKPLFDKFVKEVLLTTISATSERANVQSALINVLATEQQNPDSTWTYLLIIPTSITGSTYSVIELLRGRYGIQKAVEYQSIYNSCLKSPPVVTRLVTLN